MPGPIGKLTAVLGIDAREFSKGMTDAQKSLAGFGLKVNPVFAGIGVAAATGFGLVTKGAMQAETAQGKFMAMTGKSRDEAKKFVSGMDSLAGSAGTVGMRFEDLAALGTMVEQQFGTTGQKTIDLTRNVAEFAKVTGQDATQAANDLEDTLSAYGLSAEDAAGFMDQLVASNQKFGTDAGPATLGILRGMAPALEAMGMDLDDGVELLNAFEVAGLDAGSAQRGLQSAIKELKPGQNLDDLIAQIGAIEDPTKRAQKAIEIFGTRAGAGLAAVIKPGMTSLDDFGISAEDAAGKTGQAANDMLTLGDKIRGFADKALAGARELGQQFGPALSGLGGIASLAAGFGGTISAALKGLLNFGPIKAASAAVGAMIGAVQAEAQALAATGTAAVNALAARISGMAASTTLLGSGTTVGTAIGGALALGIATLGAVAIGAAIMQAFNDAIKNVRDNPASITDPDLFGSRAPMWAIARVNAATEMQALGQGALDAFNAEWDKGIAAGLSPQAALGPAKAAGLAIGAEVGAGITATDLPALFTATGAAAGTAGGEAVVPAWIAAQSDAAARNKDSLSLWGIVLQQQEKDAAHAKDVYDRSALAITGSLVTTLKGAKGDIGDAMDDLMWAINHPLELEKDIAEVKAALASKSLQKGLNSSNPEIKAQAEQTQARLLAIWASLDPAAAAAGDNASSALMGNLNNDYPGALSDARQFVRDINDALRGIVNGIHVNVNLDAHGRGYAAGGYVPPGTINTVGERGIERLVTLPGGGAYVVPGAGAAAASSTSTFNVTVNAPSGDAQSIADTVVNTLQRVFSGAAVMPLDRSGRPI